VTDKNIDAQSELHYTRFGDIEEVRICTSVTFSGPISSFAASGDDNFGENAPLRQKRS